MDLGVCASSHVHARGGRQSRAGLATLLAVAILAAVRRRVSSRKHSKRALRAVRSIALGAALAASLAPARALAFKCSRVGGDNGASLIWTQRSITWFADSALTSEIPDHSAALEEVKRSFHAWEEPACTDLKLPFGGEEAGLKAGYDPNGSNKNVVVFLTHGWPYDPSVVAVTTNAFDRDNGYIVDSDIEVNNMRFHFVIADATCVRATGKMDLRNTLTHEAGHFIGLDHPPDEARYADTTMFARAEACETKKRTLKQDDMDGVCFMYPPGERYKQCNPPDTASFKVVETKDGLGGCTCAAAAANRPSIAGAILFGLAGLALQQWRRRAQSPSTMPT